VEPDEADARGSGIRRQVVDPSVKELVVVQVYVIQKLRHGTSVVGG
jgi:hypothetical protein